MNQEKKLELLESAMELEEGELKAEMRLDEIDGYDSMKMLSLVVVMDEEFSKKLTFKEIKGFVTVQDVLDYME